MYTQTLNNDRWGCIQLYFCNSCFQNHYVLSQLSLCLLNFYNLGCQHGTSHLETAFKIRLLKFRKTLFLMRIPVPNGKWLQCVRSKMCPQTSRMEGLVLLSSVEKYIILPHKIKLHRNRSSSSSLIKFTKSWFGRKQGWDEMGGAWGCREEGPLHKGDLGRCSTMGRGTKKKEWSKTVTTTTTSVEIKADQHPSFLQFTGGRSCFQGRQRNELNYFGLKKAWPHDRDRQWQGIV